MRFKNLNPNTRFIIEQLKQKHTVFDLQEKILLNLPVIRQTIVRLMENDLVFVCDSKFDSIKKRQINYYKLTKKGFDFQKKADEFIIQQKIDELDKKRFIFSNSAALEKTKSFIKILTKKTKKATPWDSLLFKVNKAI
jgi:predicted transcriptional regulator